MSQQRRLRGVNTKVGKNEANSAWKWKPSEESVLKRPKLSTVKYLSWVKSDELTARMVNLEATVISMETAREDRSCRR